MTPEEASRGLVKERSAVWKAVDWLRRHITINIGRHGDKSADIGVRVEF